MTTRTLKATSIDDFYSGFDQKPTKITGKPTYADIDELRTIIYTAAASIPSTRGGGQHGHLGMVMQPAPYALLAPGTPFDIPATQPVAPIFQGTGPQIANLHHVHALALREYQETVHLNRALQKLIIPAMDEVYLKPLYGRHVGLMGQSTQDILQWLVTTYGKITERQISDNRKRLQEAYDPNDDPFQLLIDRYETIQQFASDAELPITEGEMINEGLLLLKRSGVLTRPVEIWKEKARPDRTTWNQFKAHFMEKIEDYQSDRGDTAGGSGYGALAMQHEHIDQFINYMSEQEANQAKVTTMMDQQQQMLTLLNNQAEQIKALQRHLAALPAGEAPALRDGRDPNRPRAAFVDKGFYCWSHGWTAGHANDACTSRTEGHQMGATRIDMKGGSTRGKERILRFQATGR